MYTIELDSMEEKHLKNPLRVYSLEEYELDSVE